MKPALHIKASGEVVETAPANGSDFTLEELQAFVGGYIEVLATRLPGIILIVNEDGKLRRLPENETATTLYRYGDIDPVVGDVLLCERTQLK